jgi:hypothetical protein
MNMRALFIVVILLALVAPAAVAQNSGQSLDKLVQQKIQAKGTDVLKALTQNEYKARVDIPASDSLFVDDGKVVEGMYNVALKNNKVAFKAGETAKVTQVKILDFAVQVYFNDDTAIIGTTANHADVANLSVADLTDLSVKAIGALFQIVKK